MNSLYYQLLETKLCPTCQAKIIDYQISFKTSICSIDHNHFKAHLFSEIDYSCTRGIRLNNKPYGARISIVKGIQVINYIYYNGLSFDLNHKNYVLATNEELINKINSYLILKD